MSLAREGFGTSVDEFNCLGINVAANDVMTLLCELNRKRQANLSKGNDGNLHSVARAFPDALLSYAR